MAKRIIAIILIVLGLGLVGFGIWRFIQSRKPNAGLKVETNPASMVFVDNVQIGQTPVEKIYAPGEINIKIIPNATDSALTTYQTKVKLSPRTYTVIRRDFGPTDIDTAGEIITLEPQTSKFASLAVVTSSPDSASVTIDGQPQGFTPILIPSIDPGDHAVSISAPGFLTRTIEVKAVLGFKLSINSKIAGAVVVPTPTPTPTEDVSATPSATPKITGTPKTTSSPTKSAVTVAKPYVEIKDTPTGFLRVRETASTAAKEMGQVVPGDRLPLLGQQTGWYQIKVAFPATTSGWISSQYADKFE